MAAELGGEALVEQCRSLEADLMNCQQVRKHVGCATARQWPLQWAAPCAGMRWATQVLGRSDLTVTQHRLSVPVR